MVEETLDQMALEILYEMMIETSHTVPRMVIETVRERVP